MMTTTNEYCSYCQSSSSSSYIPLRSTWARAVLNKIQNDKCLKNINRNKWYRLSHQNLLYDEYRKYFHEFYEDEETITFIKQSEKKSDNIPLQIIHSILTSLLTLFMTRTSANGLIGRGRMFVYSKDQFKTLLDIESHEESPFNTLLDIGAGDGSVTERMSKLFKKVYVTELSSTMQWRLSTYGYTVLNTDYWNNLTFDVITCLNVLDRCEKPLTLLKQIRQHLNPKKGRLIISLVLPFRPYFEYNNNNNNNNNNHYPNESIDIQGILPEEQINSFLLNIIQPLGFHLKKLTRLPYLCEGDIEKSYYFLFDYLFINLHIMSSSSSFEDKLKDLNLSNDELKRFSDAFQNEEFRKLFVEYAEELNDPKNRELYEKEIRAVEEQRGSDVTFIHPKPGHVLKTIINNKTKCFINIATNENVDKPSYNKTNDINGKSGVQWSLPHCLAGPHEDIDHESKSCTVYDVIFSPDTYRMAETNEKFMKMVEDSALDTIENNFHCKLDRNNIKILKMKFKGIPKATILRKKKENQQEQEIKNDTENELKQETDDIIEKAISNSQQNHKVVLSSHNRTVNSPPPPPTTTNLNPSETMKPCTDENGFTIPTYRIIHRGEFDMQDCTQSLVTQVRSMRPKELIIEIDLPLCASSSNVDLDVCERSLKLHCNSPKYSLDLHLPYPVRENDSHARFDKKQRKLIVTLVVIKETPLIIDVNTNIDMEDSNEESTEIIPTITTNESVTSIEKLPTNITYSSIPFEYKQGVAHVALVLHVKNIDKTSFKLENDGQHITIQLSSLGSGFYPLYHQLCLDFDEPMVLDTTENSSTTTFNDDNVLILLKKTPNDKQLTQFSSSTNREDMQINYFTVPIPVEKTESLPKHTMTKEDFIKSDSSSSSSNTDQHKKLTKKQAKKMARENRKKQGPTDDNQQLVNEISKITLQSNHNEKKSDDTNNDNNNNNNNNNNRKITSEENDDNLPDMPKVIPRSSMYRRHMSESQVDLEVSSNGKFKLKGILKNSTKYRSLSESLNDPFINISTEFQREESVFEASSAVDDLTSSNENNSIVTSPDSSGSNSFCPTSNSSGNVKHVTFNNQVSRKTFKPGGPVSGMKKLSSNQQRKLKKRKRQDSLNSQSSDQDDSINEKNKTKQSDTYKNPIEFQDVIAWQASGSQSNNNDHTEETTTTPTTKSAVRFTNPLIFELDN
ncbi:unnamed protein product [Rotaria sordida]|uniref:Protein kintoun n=1 Tax=Rotaria sordida TaxID=392033 RepID=A0A814Y553_9BILA|nr:unnamed protein product [Rotaria sordida]